MYGTSPSGEIIRASEILKGMLFVSFLLLVCSAVAMTIWMLPNDNVCNETCRYATQISGTNFAIGTESHATINAQYPIQTATRQREIELAATTFYPTISRPQTQLAVYTAVAATQTQIAVQTLENK